jgi:hypothetical protein
LTRLPKLGYLNPLAHYIQSYDGSGGSLREFAPGAVPVAEAVEGGEGHLTGGSLAAALRRHDDRIRRARDGGQVGEVVASLIGFASCAFDAGEFHASESALGHAASLAEATPAAALVQARRAAIAALRGEGDRAEHAFGLAASLAGGDPRSRAIVSVLRAESLLGVDPSRARTHAREGRGRLRAPSLWGHRAGRAEVAALLGEGRADEARHGLDLLVGARGGQRPLGRARTALLAGQVELAGGRPEQGLAWLADATRRLDRLQARYDLVRALLAWSATDAPGASEARGLARRSSRPDSAFDRLWGHQPTLAIDLGAELPVAVAGRPVRFGSRRAQVLVLLLALRAGAALPTGEACEALWPGLGAATARPRLRTVVWQVRVGLGDEAWRLRRTAGELALDLHGAQGPLDGGRPGATRPTWSWPAWAPVLDRELDRAMLVSGAVAARRPR